MVTRSDGVTALAMRNAAWAAVALAAAASLLHWLTTGTDTHSWSADAALALVAGAGLMTLAITLAAGPWSRRTTRAIALAGALGVAVVALAFAVLVAVEPSVTGPDGGHAGHGAGDDGLSSVEVVRTAVEIGLVGVLVWLHRLAGGRPPGVNPPSG